VRRVPESVAQLWRTNYAKSLIVRMAGKSGYDPPAPVARALAFETELENPIDPGHAAYCIF